jgi:hypothetical protein
MASLTRPMAAASSHNINNKLFPRTFMGVGMNHNRDNSLFPVTTMVERTDISINHTNKTIRKAIPPVDMLQIGIRRAENRLIGR